MNNIELYASVIDELVSIAEQVTEEKQNDIKKGKFVNVFSLWNKFSGLTEPIHSKILNFFLSSDAMHGQGNLFLSLFLNRIDIDNRQNDEWVTTVETGTVKTGRVDVMLKRFNPRSVVIIENKSNWAGDQPNQLYRYWYKNIHRSEVDCHPEYYDSHPEFKIVYLVPNKNKQISDNSMERPLDYPENLPQTLPIKPYVFSFKEEISDWLNECIESLPKENTPLINLISQYKEYIQYL